MLRSTLLLCTAALLSAAHPLAAQFVFQQNDNGQIVTNPDGSKYTFPVSNLWTQPYTTLTDGQDNTYPNAYTNWTTLTSYPNGAGVSATINGSCHLNESVSFQSLAVGAGGSLAIDSGNSGGAGNHSIAVAMAVGGAGTVQNAGSIAIGFAQLSTTITLANTLTLSGSGVYSMTNSATLIQGPGTLAVSTGTTLSGGGSADISASLINAGTIESVDSAGLTLRGATATNTGTLRATGNGHLELDAIAIDNTGGTISAADNGSFVLLENGVTITGGTLRSFNATSAAAGIIRVDSGATLSNFTLAAGSFLSANNGCKLVGTVVNDGVIGVPGGGAAATLTLTGDLTLAGSGTFQPDGYVVAASGLGAAPTLTIGSAQTLQGYGTPNVSSDRDVVGVNLVNNGTMTSNFLALAITGPSFTNNGTVTAYNNAYVYIGTGTTLTNYNPTTQTLNGGTYQAFDTGNGATVYLNSSAHSNNVLVNAATVVLGGTNANMPVMNTMTKNQGNFALRNLKQFTTSAALTNEGTITLDAGTTFHVGGGFTSGSAATLAVTLGGTASQGTQNPGVLQANGAATLAGNLSLTFAENAVLPGNSDTLTILSSSAPVAGSFANVANGGRLATTDGSGSFRVNYGAGTNAVVLSDFLLPGQPDTMPTATLSALVPSVAVNSGQDGEFLLTLSSAPTSDVVVNFTIKGTAINGTDYVLLKATKKIKAGHTSKPIKLIPLGDLGGAAKKTVVLTLQPGTSYTVGTTGKVKIKITD